MSNTRIGSFVKSLSSASPTPASPLLTPLPTPPLPLPPPAPLPPLDPPDDADAMDALTLECLEAVVVSVDGRRGSELNEVSEGVADCVHTHRNMGRDVRDVS